MRNAVCVAVVTFLAFTVGLASSAVSSGWAEPALSSEPPAAPVGFSGIVLRIEFYFPERRAIHIGTGFVVQDRHKEKYLITCAHLVDEKEWQSRYRITMRTFKGDRRIESYGSSLHVGQSVDLNQRGPNGQPDMTKDIVIRPAAGNWAQPLRLASADPRVGDWVWAVGCESTAPPTDEKLFLGQVLDVADGGFTVRKSVAFNPRGFSGGPVVNYKGEVVGNVLAGGDYIIGGATVSTLKRQLRVSGVKVD